MKHASVCMIIGPLVATMSAVSADSVAVRNANSLHSTSAGYSIKYGVGFLQSDRSSQPSQTRKAIVIPAGTPFRVRTIDPIDVDSTRAGTQFRGSLDDPIMLDGDVIVPRGADVVLVAARVDQGGRFKGSDLVELKVNSISVRGRAYPVVTNLAQAKSQGEGKKSTRKALGGAGLGAIIGGIAGGGSGAAIGALAGGAAGTAVAASGQPHLKIPSETRLPFQFQASLKIQ